MPLIHLHRYRNQSQPSAEAPGDEFTTIDTTSRTITHLAVPISDETTVKLVLQVFRYVRYFVFFKPVTRSVT